MHTIRISVHIFMPIIMYLAAIQTVICGKEHGDDGHRPLLSDAQRSDIRRVIKDLKRKCNSWPFATTLIINNLQHQPGTSSGGMPSNGRRAYTLINNTEPEHASLTAGRTANKNKNAFSRFYFVFLPTCTIFAL